MVRTHVAADGAALATDPSLAALGLVPLQFTGGFLQYAIVFFVLALVAALVGFRGLAGVSMEIARIFVVIFLILAVLSLVL